MDLINDYDCICVPGWTGENCTVSEFCIISFNPEVIKQEETQDFCVGEGGREWRETPNVGLWGGSRFSVKTMSKRKNCVRVGVGDWAGR